MPPPTSLGLTAYASTDSEPTASSATEESSSESGPESIVERQRSVHPSDNSEFIDDMLARAPLTALPIYTSNGSKYYYESLDSAFEACQNWALEHNYTLIKRNWNRRIIND